MFLRAVVWLLFTLSPVVLVCGCAPRIVLVRGGPTPDWVDRLPKRVGMLCATGYSGPTFYKQDCVKNASENARSHLAESISVTIRTITIDISDGTRGSFDRDVFVEGSQSASEHVLQGSEIESQWVDLHGERGAPSGCYALVCIDPDQPIEKLLEKLEEKKLPPKTVEQVRANAEAAFGELERAEEKAQEKKVPPLSPPGEKTEMDSAPKAEDSSPLSAPPSEVQVEPTQEQEQSQNPPTDTDTKKEETDEVTPAVRKIRLPTDLHPW